MEGTAPTLVGKTPNNVAALRTSGHASDSFHTDLSLRLRHSEFLKSGEGWIASASSFSGANLFWSVTEPPSLYC